MAVDHALGPPGGAGGIHQQRMILGRERRKVARGAVDGIGIEPFHRIVARGLVEDVAHAVIHECKACLAVAKRIGDGVKPGGEVDHGQAETAVERAVERLDGGAPVGHDDGDAFTLLRTLPGQRPGNAAGAVAQGGPIQGLAGFGKDEGGPASLGAGVDPVAQGALGRCVAFQFHCPATSQ